MSDDSDIFGYLEKGGKLSAPGNAPARYRAELMRIMASFIDSELAGAAGFADAINQAPGVTERIAASRIVLEKLDHAQRVLALLGEFGANTDRYENIHPWAARIGRNDDIGVTRLAGDMRLNVFHYPLEGWADAVVMNVLMGHATLVQLRELSECSYQPLASALREILPREQRHAELGEEGFSALAGGGDGVRDALNASIDYWWPRVAATFGSPQSARTEALRRFGLRRRDNDDLVEEWRSRVSTIVGETLKSWGGAH
jgi:1,2-phenylacetyl-CoA epoxidase catalytic subunit